MGKYNYYLTYFEMQIERRVDVTGRKEEEEEERVQEEEEEVQEEEGSYWMTFREREDTEI
jgi:hypothetical protein